jgi:hypothetical protein
MILYPQDAPFSTTVIPRGASRYLTQEEADAANTLWPVPPYGATYFPPGPPEPPAQSSLKFLRLTGITPDGTNSWADLSPEDEAKLGDKDTITIWPIAGRAGILDDLVARAVRINGRSAGRIKINVDTDGLNLTGLVLLGVVFVGD